MNTRSTNADKHPGLIDQKPKASRRTSEEVAMERQQKEEAKQQRLQARNAKAQRLEQVTWYCNSSAHGRSSSIRHQSHLH